MGLHVSDMIGRDIEILKDGSVLGTLHKVERYEKFSSVPEEQSGYYFPIHLPGEGEHMSIYVNGVARHTYIDFDPDIIIRIKDSKVTCTITVDGAERIKLKFDRATFEE